MTPDYERIPWWDAEPRAYQREVAAMAAVAPELTWVEEDISGAWRGLAPVWPFVRPSPPGLGQFLDGARMAVSIEYTQAHPIVPPRIYPIEPEPDFSVRTFHEWHVSGDGSLCLMQNATDWTPTSTAADLVVKASAWFLEYVLLIRGVRDEMTECGIVNDDSLDAFFDPFPS